MALRRPPQKSKGSGAPAPEPHFQAPGFVEPDVDCPLCPRLVAFRMEARAQEPEWRNAPVPAFGPRDASLVIVGLAPGLRGANRTGRAFTGDWAGDLLYATLLKYGFAEGVYDERPDDGLTLQACRIVNAVRCVPPQNKPTPAEITTCRPFLTAHLTLGQPRAIVALGRIAHESVLRALGARLAAHPFAHGAEHKPARENGYAATLFDSYHCSRYNTNTGVLTTDMFEAVFARVRDFLDR